MSINIEYYILEIYNIHIEIIFFLEYNTYRETHGGKR